MEHLPEPAVVDQLTREGNCRHAAVVEPHQRRPAARRRDHRAAFLDRHRQRLLAEHDLARLGGGDRRRRVQMIRAARCRRCRCRGGRWRRASRWRSPPSPSGRPSRRARPRSRPHSSVRRSAIRQVVEVAGLSVGVRVGLAHEALAEESDAQLRCHCVMQKTNRRSEGQEVATVTPDLRLLSTALLGAGSTAPCWPAPGRPSRAACLSASTRARAGTAARRSSRSRTRRSASAAT